MAGTTRYGTNPPPIYPRLARARGYEGTVYLDVRVRADGSVAHATVRRSSGHAILDEAALDAVRRWVFVPARRGETPIEEVVTVPIKFALSASR